MQYITAKQAAEQMNLSLRRVNQFLEAGRLPATKFSGVWMIRQDDLDTFAAIERRVGKPRKETLATD